ncbi:hypothetical protein NP493_3g11041 [Ridgeia piscesae]|uniref:Uncharacterized protein n=1 Tax=Ridgeia piscesae TaxID=27915 RepID=A0AAD9PFV8_RIDPI|nr:hypothetical protein NP493_3g11041 [Ridgeia piscesae]
MKIAICSLFVLVCFDTHIAGFSIRRVFTSVVAELRSKRPQAATTWKTGPSPGAWYYIHGHQQEEAKRHVPRRPVASPHAMTRAVPGPALLTKLLQLVQLRGITVDIYYIILYYIILYLFYYFIIYYILYIIYYILYIIYYIYIYYILYK